MTGLMVRFGSQWLSPQPLIKETFRFFMAKLRNQQDSLCLSLGGTAPLNP